jgi:hypothetical protein
MPVNVIDDAAGLFVFRDFAVDSGKVLPAPPSSVDESPHLATITSASNLDGLYCSTACRIGDVHTVLYRSRSRSANSLSSSTGYLL